MLAYTCENCGNFTLAGYTNEFNEHFCSEECYKKYCKKHTYEEHLEKLKPVENALTK